MNANFLNQTYGQSPPHHHPSPIIPHQSSMYQIINSSNQKSFFKKKHIPLQPRSSCFFNSPNKKMLKKRVFWGRIFSEALLARVKELNRGLPRNLPRNAERSRSRSERGAPRATLAETWIRLSRIGGIGWVFGSPYHPWEKWYIYLHLDGWLIFFFG